MSLTPIDILHIQFKNSLKGYNRAQVDDFIKSAGVSLEEALREKCELQRKIDQMQEEIDRMKSIESTMSEALTLAQKAADEIKVSAHKQAELILQEAEQARVQMNIDAQKAVERFRIDAELLEVTRDRFESEFRAMLGRYSDWLDKRKPNEMIHSEVA